MAKKRRFELEAGDQLVNGDRRVVVTHTATDVLVAEPGLLDGSETEGSQ